MERSVVIGVLALQGGVAEHLQAFRALDSAETAAGRGCVAVKAVKTVRDLAGLDGIVLPGGESSAVGKLLSESGLMDALRGTIDAGLPAWGTCMGAILLARDLENDNRRHLGLMDITVRRNAYGGQLDSFIEGGAVSILSPDPFPMVFIRAPLIVSVGPEVSVLAWAGGFPVACVQGRRLATTFHPELTDDRRFHEYFVSLVRERGGRAYSVPTSSTIEGPEARAAGM
jgi:5'-phosphate synthase pdxT subunit